MDSDSVTIVDAATLEMIVDTVVTATRVDDAHPITTGVVSPSSQLYSSGVEAKGGPVVLARWVGGVPLVGFRRLSAGQRVVGVGLFPGAGNTATGDVTTLWNNVVGWAGEAGGSG